MANASYWQRGETLDFINDTEETIEAGTVVTFGERIGVAGTDIPPGTVGAVHVTGVYGMPKTVDAEVRMGIPVYLDGEGITDTKGDAAVLAGYAAQTAAAGDAEILVKLLG